MQRLFPRLPNLNPDTIIFPLHRNSEIGQDRKGKSTQILNPKEWV